jgi:hypothetical protein
VGVSGSLLYKARRSRRNEFFGDCRSGFARNSDRDGPDGIAEVHGFLSASVAARSCTAPTSQAMGIVKRPTNLVSLWSTTMKAIPSYVVFCLLEMTEVQQAVFLSVSRRSDCWPRHTPNRVIASNTC